MDRRTINENGRKRYIRESGIGQKQKVIHKANIYMRKAGRYHAIDTAKKQAVKKWKEEAELDHESSSAVDKVESFAASTVQTAMQLPASALEWRRWEAKKNAFHRETQKRDIENQKSSPQKLMRRAFAKDIERRRRREGNNSFHAETDYPDTKNGIGSGVRKRSQRQETLGEPQILPKSYPSIHRSAREHPVLPAHILSPENTTRSRFAIERGRRYARDKAIHEITGGTTYVSAKTTTKVTGDVLNKLGSTIAKAFVPEKETMLYAAGLLLLIIIPFVAIMGVASMLVSTNSKRSVYLPVSEEVEAYTPVIQIYAAQYGIPEYTELIKAVMMQESGGQGLDPMQCSESSFNTRYSHEPNSITDPEYSIDVGVQCVAYVLKLADVESPIDLAKISLALQGYNYGSGYITWALANYGGYTELNAIEFSNVMAARMGWSNYGDKSYVSHVLRYYPIGRLFMSEGSEAMVEVARSQLGNVGGEPYWSWWGLNYRVEWCAIFVSWVADQCGYIESDVLPKTAGVLPFIDWFRERGQWQERNFEPISGDIIFFDYEGDGIADHVGIVERVENGIVYTIEGNTDDRCGENRYRLGASPIFGYGLPLY